MINDLGYKKNLFILPFDHRSSFAKLLGFTNPSPSSEEKEAITQAKEIIYASFKKAVEQEISKEEAAILIDEEYGDKIIQDALIKKYNVILTTEKSGQNEFSFEYGEEFASHIEKYRPSIVKSLIRYQEGLDWSKLKILSDYCHNAKYKFLLEILTNNKTKDEEIMAISEFQNKNIEPDIWKLEGMKKEEDYQDIVQQAQNGNRKDVKIVVLGRGAEEETVEKWISIAGKVKGIIGFAVGRTIFWEPLVQYKNNKIEKEKTIETICNNFLHFYRIFTNKD
jgi:myo-inositol catabolism protein IolC